MGSGQCKMFYEVSKNNSKDSVKDPLPGFSIHSASCQKRRCYHIDLEVKVVQDRATIIEGADI